MILLEGSCASWNEPEQAKETDHLYSFIQTESERDVMKFTMKLCEFGLQHIKLQISSVHKPALHLMTHCTNIISHVTSHNSSDLNN